MLMNEISIFFSAFLIFSLGVVLGARMVYRFRHVTTKSLHQSFLNTLQLQGQMMARSTRSSTDNEDVFIVLEDDCLEANTSAGILKNCFIADPPLSD